MEFVLNLFIFSLQARAGQLEGQLLGCACRLAVKAPSIVVAKLLAPVLSDVEDSAALTVSRLIAMTDSPQLKHAMLRCVLLPICLF